ncbi:hypothetical protein OAS39_04065 [Pirellulales bacterium]|nr:hypothetical protein [Pirellulales bacterium]
MNRKRNDAPKEIDNDSAGGEPTRTAPQRGGQKKRPTRARRSRGKNTIGGIHMRCNKKSNW